MTQQRYVEQILDLYRRTPGTRGLSRPADRRLAASLRQRGVPLELVEAALLVATARRALRPATAPPLAPIATLHYFLPVLEELLASPPDPAYLAYLQRRLAALAPALATRASHRLS
jgi:hypothetical protein